MYACSFHRFLVQILQYLNKQLVSFPICHFIGINEIYTNEIVYVCTYVHPLPLRKFELMFKFYHVLPIV